LVVGANQSWVKYRCISAYILMPYLRCRYLYISFTYCIYALFTLSLLTNHKCTQPCYFPLLLKSVAQMKKMDWNSSTRSSRLRVAPVAIPMVLWSFCYFISLRVDIVLKYIIYVIIILYIHDIWLSVDTFGRMCGTIEPGSCIRWVLDFGIKIRYDRLLRWELSHYHFCHCSTCQLWGTGKSHNYPSKRGRIDIKIDVFALSIWLDRAYVEQVPLD
jgi:hypothetical protein